MNSQTLPSQLQLARKALYSIADASGIEVTCAEGAVWLTLDGDEQDYVLEAGQSFETPEHRRALVYAFEPSRISLACAEPMPCTRYRRNTTMEMFNRFQAMPLRKAAR
jgi:hypothetical protein